MVYEYPVVFLKDDNGSVIASVPDIPGTMTVGADRNEALARVQGALLTMLAGRIEDHESIPPPSPPAKGQRTTILPPLVTAKLSVYAAMKARRVSKEALAQRLNWDEDRVGRVLDVRRRSRLEDIEAALATLGKRLVIDVANAA